MIHEEFTEIQFRKLHCHKIFKFIISGQNHELSSAEIYSFKKGTKNTDRTFTCLDLNLIQPAFKDSNSTMKIQKNLGNLFKVNNKDTRTPSMKSLCCFIVNLEQISHFFKIFAISKLAIVQIFSWSTKLFINHLTYLYQVLENLL